MQGVQRMIELVHEHENLVQVSPISSRLVLVDIMYWREHARLLLTGPRSLTRPIDLLLVM